MLFNKCLPQGGVKETISKDFFICLVSTFFPRQYHFSHSIDSLYICTIFIKAEFYIVYILNKPVHGVDGHKSVSYNQNRPAISSRP